MKGILVLLLIHSFLATAQEKTANLGEGEGKSYDATFTNGKSLELFVYIGNKSKDSLLVECQVRDMDPLTPFRFWQAYEWKLLKDGRMELSAAYVFSSEMNRPQKLTPAELPKDVGIPLTAELLFPLPSLEKKKGDYELRFKSNLKSRPSIINVAKAETLDAKGKEILNFPYSCR